ncbi:hypothetical protein EDB87DRAFT_1132126 [Lactarius vividus]|nr:hypothetical protein EDB87DRAFT_1132126 [Lactarius vividus]
MADSDLLWNIVLPSDSSSVSFFGNWSAYTQGGFRNVSNPETNVSVTFHFHGTQARAVGFVTPSLGYDPLQARTWGPEGSIKSNIPSVPHCNGDGTANKYTGDTERCPPVFYTTALLQCNLYTLNFTVMPGQAMRLKQFESLPCISDPAYTSTTAVASASSPASAIAAEKKQTLSAGVIAGAALGALAALLALGSLAFLIMLRRRRRHRRRIGTLPSPSSPPPSPSPSPFLICFSRPGSWLRLVGRHPKPTNPSAEFLTSSSSSSPVPASRRDGRIVQGHYPTTTMMIDASGSTSVSAAFETTGSAGPWSSAQPAGNARTAFEKQPLRPDDVEPEPSGLAVAHGYLPDSKESMAWREREQERAAAQGLARTPVTTEALPLYQSRRSLRRPSH